jgi:aspartate--ammonia ligase
MLDKREDLAEPGIDNYSGLEKIQPEGYRSVLSLKETQIAVFDLKDYLEENLCKELNLIRVTVPLIVGTESGVADLRCLGWTWRLETSASFRLCF